MKLFFSGNVWLLVILALVLISVSIFVYRFTLPKVSSTQRIYLTVLRSLIFIIILSLIFEPILSLFYKNEKERSAFIFIDNSNSIAAKDSSERTNLIKNFTKQIKNAGLRSKFFLFGSKIDSTHENVSTLKETETNYSLISNLLKRRNSEVNAAVILSDGIITEGIDPIYEFEKEQIPIYTVGIGDSSLVKDIEIYSATHNQFVYAGKETKIETIVRQNGFSGKQTKVNFYEEGTLLDSKDVLLNESGMNKINFSYTPKTGGEKKLTISVSPLSSEKTTLNNSKTIFLNVLSSKIKVALITGSPTSDYSAIASSLSKDPNYQIYKLVQTASNKIWSEKRNVEIDSADVLFLLDFPSVNTSNQLLNQVSDALEKGKPFFISLGASTDLRMLQQFEKYLPITIRNFSPDIVQIQPEIVVQEFTSQFSQLGSSNNIWTNLPPINQIGAAILPKPESKVIVKTMTRGIPLSSPLITVRSIGNQRSFCINGWDYWRWNLQIAEKYPDFFPNFVNEIVKWLNISQNKKQFYVSSNKKIYSPGEAIELTAELYDKAFNPIDTSTIQLNVRQNQNVQNITFTSAGNGIYTATYIPDSQGDFTFDAQTSIDNQKLFSSGRFNVSNISVEKIDTRMRTGYLQQIANLSGGSYFPIENYSQLIKYLRQREQHQVSSPLIKKEIEFWNNRWTLLIIVLLFSLEWFSRKRWGML